MSAGGKVTVKTAERPLPPGLGRCPGNDCARDELRENPAPFGAFSRRALELGCDGVVSSGLEARALRDAFGERLVVVVPGVRPVDNTDDQKRTVNVAQAFENGADYIVVGRPIRDADDPRRAAEAIQEEIAAACAARGG